MRRGESRAAGPSGTDGAGCSKSSSLCDDGWVLGNVWKESGSAMPKHPVSVGPVLRGAQLGGAWGGDELWVRAVLSQDGVKDSCPIVGYAADAGW